MDKKKKIAAQKIETPQETVAFILKYNNHPNLHKHESDLLELITFLEEFSFHRFIRVEKEFDGKSGKRKYARKEYSRRVESLEKLKAKIKKWHDRPMADALKKFEHDIDTLIAAYEQSTPDSMQGKRKKPNFRLLASTTKAFWIETLGHENFVYDDSNPNEDFAKEFIEDLVMALFRGTDIQNINNLAQAFRDIAVSKTHD